MCRRYRETDSEMSGREREKLINREKENDRKRARYEKIERVRENVCVSVCVRVIERKKEEEIQSFRQREKRDKERVCMCV